MAGAVWAAWSGALHVGRCPRLLHRRCPTNTSHSPGPLPHPTHSRRADIKHDPGRGAPMVAVKFRNAYRNQKDHELMIAPEGVYTGQFVYAGKKAQL